MAYRVQFELTGLMPLLMHWDNIAGSDLLEEWRQDPKNKDQSKAGDDRRPAWTWQNYVYSDGEFVTIPQDNVMAALMYGGNCVPPWWKTSKKSCKELTQSGLVPETEHCRFEFSGGQQLSIAQLDAMRELPFAQQVAACEQLGFRLFCKRAGVNGKKHVRVRPRFDAWRVIGQLHVVAEDLPLDKLELFFDYAGRGGIGDWRPSSPKRPGPYGMFTTKLTRIK